MRRFQILALAVWALSVSLPCRAGIIIRVDESGNGSYDLGDGKGSQNMPGAKAMDPLNNNVMTLTYTLPAGAMATDGDLRLSEPNTTFLIASDLIRFKNNKLFFYSNLSAVGEEASPPLADQGNDGVIPSSANVNNTITKGEIGNELDNGLGYTPNQGNPGFGPNSNTYLIVSDGNGGPSIVPEPSTIAAAVFGLIAGVGFLRRR